MMSSRTMVLFLVVSVVSVSVLGTAFAAPLGTAFTYQGKLTTSTGEPVNSTADFRFTLWDADSGGSQIGSLVSVDAVSVSGGLFTVSLDFGSSSFTGSARWLEIAVRTPAGSGSYTLFGTRQQVVAVPYAMYSLSSAPGAADTVDGFHANSTPTPSNILPLNESGKLPLSVLYTGIGTGLDADLLDGNHGSFYQNASNLNAGTLTDARLSTNVALLNNGQNFTGAKTFSNAANNFTGNGAGLTSLNASNLAYGTVADARLSTNVALLNNTQTFTGAKTFSNAANSFTGNGSGLTNLNASNLTSGSIPDGRLSANVALLNTIQTFSANKFFSGNVGIGVVSASHPLVVENPSNSNFARAIYGLASGTGTGQQVWGVYSETHSTATTNPGGGVLGFANAATGTSTGVRGESASDEGTGVYAWATSPTGVTYGLKAVCSSSNGWAGHFSGRGYFSGNVGIGVQSPQSKLDITSAISTEPSLSVLHTTALNDQPAVYGEHAVTDNYGIGVKGVGGYMGISAACNPTGSGAYYGIYSVCSGGSGNNRGIYSFATNGTTNYGVLGYATNGNTAYGVYGSAGGAATNYAGYFQGNVHVTGTLSAGTKTFKIDHPLDPENKYLNHYCVEGPEILNVYSGNIVTDESGYASVKLPDYFEAINKDFRYQLTVVGQFAQAIVSKKIENNRFVVQTDKPSVEVSWEVTGVRNDKWAKVYAVAVEQDKVASEKGKYLFPDLYGKSPESGIGYMPPPEMDKDMVSRK